MVDVNRFYDRIRHRDAARAATGTALVEGFDSLADDQYALVVTYRRSGEAVPTPVWFARDGERLVFRTGGETAKVKRIRREPRVRVARCSVRGKPKGPAIEGRARVLDPAEEDAAERALDAKYGLKRRTYMRASPEPDAVYVEVVPAA
jgi:hypothetical protein